MDIRKFLFVFGMLFVVLGIIFGALFIIPAIIRSSPGSVIFGVAFLAIFSGVGGFFAWAGRNMLSAEKNIIENGYVIKGKIFDYAPDSSLTMNGSPVISLRVRYFDKDEIHEVLVPTGRPDTWLFPRGKTVSVSILDGAAALIDNSVSDEKLAGEDLLMNPDMNYSESGLSTKGKKCPSCGSNLFIPQGMSVICPYCGRKVSYDE